MRTIGIFGIPDLYDCIVPRYTHDHCVTVMERGKVLASIELERITGLKHDNRLPEHLMSILEPFLDCGDIRFISSNSFMGSSFTTSDGSLRIEPQEKLELSEIFSEANVIMAGEGGIKKGEGNIICHEFAHIASILPFVGEFLPNSLLVHIDGGASVSASSFWYKGANNIELLDHSWDELKIPVNNFNVGSLGLALLNKNPDEHLSLPGKLMGYAALGESDPLSTKWLIEKDWFFNESKKTILKEINKWAGTEHRAFDPHISLFANLARCVQDHLTDSILKSILHWKEITGATNLYYSGGAALNIITNRMLELKGGFDKIFIPPCPSDCGLSLGAASWLEYVERGRLELHDPFLNGLGCTTDHDDSEIDEVKRRILESKVLGIRNGASEIGPRALGHRSIICRADDPRLSRKVSMDIKGREWYRPIAPILCESAANEVLEQDALQSELTKYMLGSYHIREGWVHELSGVTHGEGGVRAQIVYEADLSNSWMHTLLQELWEEHGVPCLVNTSFNIRGQPIIHTEKDALHAFKTMGLDGVVIDGSLHID